jgi:tripartite-type tricarboxylate transporter receptor subunit TctC
MREGVMSLIAHRSFLIGTAIAPFAPSSPADIVDRINAAVNAFLRNDKGKHDLAKLDSLPAGGTPAETKAFIAAEVRKWGPIIQAADINKM